MLIHNIKSHFVANLKSRVAAGDTIVEVLLAIAIAGFAVGISYATAQRSLQTAISAKEHNEALNLLENQISALQARYNSYQQNSIGPTFQSDFGAGRSTNNNYCLDELSTGPSDRANQWTPYFNSSISAASPLTSPPYIDNSTHTACVRPSGNGFNYYLNIVVSLANTNNSVFQVIVRWERIGGGQINQTSLYYKI